jgi:hypothetical protein
MESFCHWLTALAEVYARHAARHGPSRLSLRRRSPRTGACQSPTNLPAGLRSRRAHGGHEEPLEVRNDGMDPHKARRRPSASPKRPTCDGALADGGLEEGKGLGVTVSEQPWTLLSLPNDAR